MNILCVIDSLGSGGAQRQLVELAIEFKKNNNNVCFLVYHEIDFYKSLLDKYGIKISYVLEKNYIVRIVKMRSIIRKGKYDAVLSFLESPNLICEVAGLPFRKWKLVVGERSANPNILNSNKLIMYRYMHFFADYIVSNSYSNLDIIKKINPLLIKKSLVIYNMIDFNKWQSNNNYTPLKNNKFNLLIAASLGATKNPLGLIEALNLLQKKDKEKISISWYGQDYGDINYKKALNKIKDYKLENIISFYPSTMEIATLMNNSDCIGLFSFFEGFPNAICEGMALGKPVISSSVSDLPLILDNKFLFNPQKPESIANTLHFMLSLSSDELFEIGQKNKEKASLFFDKNDIVKKYLNILSYER